MRHINFGIRLVAALLLSIVITVSAQVLSSCAAPWETSGADVAKTLYSGTLAGALAACRVHGFASADTRWQRACSFLQGLPESLGATAEPPPEQPQRVRILASGRVELL